jgi:uncharacterized protein (TIGR02246 family)
MMNKISRTFAQLVFALATAPTLAHANTDQDERAIRQTLSRYESALNAADTASVVNLYTPDGVQMAPDAPAAEGRAAVTAAYDELFKAVALQLSFTVDEVSVLNKTTAYLRSHSSGVVRVNGSEHPAAFKELFLLRKQAGQWKFSHYSFSAAPAAQK